MKQHAVESRGFRRFLGNRPRLVFNDVFIHASDKLPGVFKGAREGEVLEIRAVIPHYSRGKLPDVLVANSFSGSRNFSVPVLGNHRAGATQQIAEVVGQVAVPSLDNGVIAEIAVLAENHLPQQVVTDQFGSED